MTFLGTKLKVWSQSAQPLKEDSPEKRVTCGNQPLKSVLMYSCDRIVSLLHVHELIFSESKHLLAIFGILFCTVKLGKFNQFGPIRGEGAYHPL